MCLAPDNLSSQKDKESYWGERLKKLAIGTYSDKDYRRTTSITFLHSPNKYIY